MAPAAASALHIVHVPLVRRTACTRYAGAPGQQDGADPEDRDSRGQQASNREMLRWQREGPPAQHGHGHVDDHEGFRLPDASLLIQETAAHQDELSSV